MFARHAWRSWLIGSLITGTVAAQAPSLLKNVDTFQDGPTTFESFEGNLRSSERIAGTTDFGLSFETLLYRGNRRDYGDDTLERTREKTILTRLAWDDRGANTWFVGIDFSRIGQNTARFSANEFVNNASQTSFSLLYGWKRTLFGGLDVTLYSGLSTCYAADEDVALLPVGGLVLATSFARGGVALEFANKVAGTGEASGIYGSQKRREVKLSGDLALARDLSLTSYCLVSHVDANFAVEGTRVDQMPLLTASVDLTYRWTDRLATKVGFSHRAYLDGDSHDLPDGPMAGLSVNYLAF